MRGRLTAACVKILKERVTHEPGYECKHLAHVAAARVLTGDNGRSFPKGRKGDGKSPTDGEVGDRAYEHQGERDGHREESVMLLGS